MAKKRKINKDNIEFLESMDFNNAIYNDYLNRLTRLALSMFEWINLPNSMNAEFLEKTLFTDGMATLLFDEKYGFINTKCTTNEYFNIYNLPTSFNCCSFDYNTSRKLYTGLLNEENQINDTCILVKNNVDLLPTLATIQLFAYKLYEADITAFINVKAQKTPVALLVEENDKLTIKNLYSKYEGNAPVIIGDKNKLKPDSLTVFKTDAPFVADKITDYKKEIWNEVLTFLGINNILVDKKERLITDEANSNNELINLNLQSYLKPRKFACKQFNEFFGMTGENEIDVKVSSDLHNIIKNTQSAILKEGEEIVKLYD